MRTSSLRNGSSVHQEDPSLILERILAGSAQPAASVPPNSDLMQIDGEHRTLAQQNRPTPSYSRPVARDQFEMAQDVKPELREDSGARCTVKAEPEMEVPQCLIYGGATGEDEFLIPGRSLQKLPKDVLQYLLKDGDRMGALHRLGSTPNWESLVRLGQYLEFGDYKPFRPHTPLEFLDTASTAILWTSRDSLNAVAIPNATYELFLREVDFYLFLSKIGYAELRRISAERLCTRYPKSVKSIWVLIDKIPQVAEQNGDNDVMQRLVSYINTNIKELSVLPEFLPLLQKLTRGRPPLGPVLLEAFISSSLADRRELAALSGSKIAVPRKNSPPSEPLALRAKISGSVASPSSTATGPPRSPNLSSFFSASGIEGLVTAIRNQSLVVATDNGYGTLVRDGHYTGRNREFEFARGELLVVDGDSSACHGRHNIKVTNSRGEVGDILRTLVKKVPGGLGVLGPVREESFINAGERTRAQDREMRSIRSFGNTRARSRSPTWGRLR